MRIVAALAGEQKLLDVFERISRGEKADPHAVNGEAFFGAEFIAAQKVKGESKANEDRFARLRDFAKCVVGTTRVDVAFKNKVAIKELQPRPMVPGEMAPLKDTYVIGSDGRHKQATHFYYGGSQKVFRMRTVAGHEIEGTGKHRLLRPDGSWIRLDEITPADDFVVALTFLGTKRPVRVASCEPSGDKEVYDLVVPDGEAFVANGLVNHNTGHYAILYGATFDTYYETLTSAEDDKGNLPFVHYGQKAIRATFDNWVKNSPATVRWWETEPELYRKQGFLADLLFGYRCDFLDGEEDERQRNKLLNFRAQATLATVVHSAAIELTDGPNAPIPFQCYGPGTGLVLNGHDRLDFELPTFHPRRWADLKDPRVGWCEKGCTCPLERARQLVTNAMTRKGARRIPGLPVDFTAEAKVIVGQWV